MNAKDYKIVCRIIMYDKIQSLRNEEHKSIQWIADHLGVNFRTVKKYLEMTRDEFETFSNKVANKPHLLALYKSFIVERLTKYPDTPAAQMHDWLKEHYPEFPKVSPKTVYNYVMKLRSDYNLPKVSEPNRQYRALPLTPPGEYAQVDFGHKKLRCGNGAMQTVHFMAMLLCHSRYKFIWFQDVPFTSASAIEAHERAFEFFHGIPKHIVYDQDAVFLYDENIGDYKMTDLFSSYVKSRPFTAVFCRPADPESKGKVENCVKYVKQNFLLNRQYSSLENLNTEAVQWLNRTGNMMEHGTTCRVPYEVWSTDECKELLPYMRIGTHNVEEGHKVLKTNSIKYRGNAYSVPLGTYKDNSSRVIVKEQGANLVITSMDGTVIAQHLIPAGSGNVVINRNHYRNVSTSISRLTECVMEIFQDREGAAVFIAEIRSRYPRYMRDQLATIQELSLKYGKESADAALEFCLRNRLYSANEFKSFITIAKRDETADVKPEIKPLGDESANLLSKVEPGKSSIDEYEHIWIG